MMATAGTILLAWLAALGLCLWCGWGLTRLLLPPALHPYRAALTPLVGYTVVIWVGYNAVHSLLSLRQALPLLLALTATVNAGTLMAINRRGSGQSLHVRARRIWRSLVHPLAPILIITALIGVLPLFHYGYVTVIGGGWDSESYLALTAHLTDYRLADIAHAPASPLRNHVVNPPIIGLSMGFSIVHSFTVLLSGQSELQTFAPLLALMRVLGFLAVYVWLRATMGLRRSGAFWATALAAAGGLLLWVTYFNFGMQLAAWPLIPLVLTISVAAVEDASVNGKRAWPGLLLAALAWAAIPMIYYPALTAAVPMAVGLAAVLLFEQRRRAVGRTLLAIIAVPVLTVPLSTWVIPDYFAGFAYRYANALTTLGLFRFIPISDILGWTAFDLMQAAGYQAPWYAGLAVSISGLLALAALTLGPLRARWVAALTGAALYLLWVRYGRVYHYAYLKGSAYVGFVAMGLLAAGWQGLCDRSGRPLRAAGALSLALLLALAAQAQAQIVRDHWAGPAIVAPEIVELDRAVDALIPETATVLLTSDPRWGGVQMSTIAAALYPRPLRGHVLSAYSGMDEVYPGEQPDFALLAAEEQPAALGLVEAREVWRSGGLRLYAMPRDGRPSLIFGRMAELVTRHTRTPSDIALRRWGGAVQAR